MNICPDFTFSPMVMLSAFLSAQANSMHGRAWRTAIQ
jgi:hypothetical protein